MIRSPRTDNYRPSSVRAGYLFYIVISLIRYSPVLTYYISDISVCRVHNTIPYSIQHSIIAFVRSFNPRIPDDRRDGRVSVSPVVMHS